jgi:hypothetical protein
MTRRGGFGALFLSLLLIEACTVDRSGSALRDGSLQAPDGRVPPPPDARVDPPDARMGQDARVDPPDACVPGPELCNGVDDDCDPATPDGADDPMIDEACDGADADLCAEGVYACVDGAPTCGDTTDDSAEVCNGADDDCDASTPDGADDPEVGVPCDGPDADECEEGTTACAGGDVVCGDESGDSAETCDGTDEDCDGAIDEGAGCPCTRRTRMGRSYLFCGTGRDRRNFAEAAAFCAERGYGLVKIEDAAENEWVAAQIGAIDDADWWIGATDAAVEGTWLWLDGSAVTYENWRDEEPAGNGDCVELDPGETVDGTPGSWNDVSCGGDKRFVCEAGP